MAQITIRRIPEIHVEGKRLGRHVRHDSRSLAYQVEPVVISGLVSVRHERHIPVLDQGDLGSCTGNAAEGCVGTSPLFEALPAGNPYFPPTLDEATCEREAVEFYSEATKLDDIPGSYPPDDTGSDGLSVAKVALKVGLISGYQHAMSLDAALTALAAGPVITGVNWYDSFDTPSPTGVIAIARGAVVRGGHEFVVDELNVEHQLVGFTNSWGDAWGVQGRAYMSWDTWGQLLSEQGDVTVFVPVDQPAPVPTPTPIPTPTPAPDPDQTLATAARAWLAHHHVADNARFAHAVRAWLMAKDL